MKIGNYTSKVSMSKVVNQITSRPIGFFNVNPLYEGTPFSFVDYQFTSLSLYVPYCGNISIPASIAIGKTISVTLFVDVMSGDCCATIYINSEVFAILSGNCAFKYPLTGANFSTSFAGGLTGGSFRGLMENVFSVERDRLGFTGADVRGGLSGAVTGVANDRCVLTITRPRVYGNPDRSINATYDCLIRGKLSSFNGFVKVSKWYQPSGDLGLATKEELSEIESLLAEGVYL